MVATGELVRFCDELLGADRFRDIALNGLQIEGAPEVNHITTAVSCNLQVIEAAIERGSNAILVHHGLVLNGQVGHITGPVRQRLKGILANDINLIGYHLPLDGHPDIGNNGRLAAALELDVSEEMDTYGPPAIGYICETRGQVSAADLGTRLEQLTGNAVVRLNSTDAEVRRIAVMCGSGAPALEEAALKGCQVLVTGDAREPTMAMARELGMTVLVGGHEATERLGVRALADRLEQEFGVRSDFVSDPNPL